MATEDTLSITYLTPSQDDQKPVEKIEQLDTILELDTDFWKTEKGQWILGFNGAKKIAEHCKIQVSREYPPALLVSPTGTNHQQHVFGVWLEYVEFPKACAFGVGEANTLNTGEVGKNPQTGAAQYFERSKIDSKYKAKMAFKRAYVTALVQLVKLNGVYGDVESADFERPGEKSPIQDYDKL